MQKNRNNPQANSSEFAYVRIVLELILEISFDAIIALAFSIFEHIRIEYNICYSVFFCIKFENKTLISRYFNIIFNSNISKTLILYFLNTYTQLSYLIIANTLIFAFNNNC